jgi:tetratricopeptide (TPR) repeat protein
VRSHLAADAEGHQIVQPGQGSQDRAYPRDVLKRSRSVVMALDALEIVQAPMLFGGLADSCGTPALGFARSIATMRRHACRPRDVFAIQDEVTRDIVATIVGQVQAAGIDNVRRRRTDSLAAYDCFLRGLEHRNRSGSDDTGPARDMFARAVEIDPNFAQAHALLAEMLVEVAVGFWTPDSRNDYVTTLARAIATAQRAVALDGNDARCHCALAYAYMVQKSFDFAVHHLELARRLNPNDSDTFAHQSLLEVFLGQPKEALHSFDLAMRLNPIAPNWYYESKGLALYSLRRYAEATDILERTTAKRPYVYRYLAACYAKMGRFSEAGVRLAESFRLHHNVSADAVVHIDRVTRPHAAPMSVPAQSKALMASSCGVMTSIKRSRRTHPGNPALRRLLTRRC